MTIFLLIMVSQVIYPSRYKVTHLSISEEDFACYQNCWNDEHPKSVEIINENKIRALYNKYDVFPKYEKSCFRNMDIPGAIRTFHSHEWAYQ